MSQVNLPIQIHNVFPSNTIYVHITGGVFQNTQRLWWVLRSDGRTGYQPPMPPTDGFALNPTDFAFAVAPGQSSTITVPYLDSARIYISLDEPLHFFLNQDRGSQQAAIVTPSITNPSDKNLNISWGFCEFNYGQSGGIFGNLSYVDMVSIPIGMQLTHTNGAIERVAGMPSNGLATFVNFMENAGGDWPALIYRTPSTNKALRVVSPDKGMALNSSRDLFSGLFDSAVNALWAFYSSTNPPQGAPPGGHVLSIDTQTGRWGIATGQNNSSSSTFTFTAQNADPGTNTKPTATFTKPNAGDIFGGNSGPFNIGSDTSDFKKNLIPRINAELNRGVALTATHQFPAPQFEYYRNPAMPMNHYSNFVHQVNTTDHRGYGFSYDDVKPSPLANGPPIIDSAGTVNDTEAGNTPPGPNNHLKFEIVAGGYVLHSGVRGSAQQLMEPRT